MLGGGFCQGPAGGRAVLEAVFGIDLTGGRGWRGA